MTRVPWATLPGELVEDLVAALLLLSRGSGHQITPSRGDRGIDVRETVPGGVRVTQIKRYTGPLSARQKREIEKSLTTFLDQGVGVVGQVESWTLAMPCNPTTETGKWFEALTADCGFPVTWLGRTQLDVLAAERPDIVDYFLGDGAAEVKRLMAEAMRGSAPIDGVSPGHDLLAAVVDRQQHLAGALDAVDPFYSYQVEVRAGTMPPEDEFMSTVGTDSDFVRYEQVTPQTYLVTRVRPRSAQSLWLRPIARTIQFDVEPGTPEHDAVDHFVRYGAPLASVPATTVSASGPPGTTGTGSGAGLVSFFPGGDPVDGLELRLLSENTDDVLARLGLTNQVVSAGMTGEGQRVAATDTSGVLSVEALFGFGTDKLNLQMSGWGNKPVRLALPLVELLGVARPGSRFALGVSAGPQLAQYNPIPGPFGPPAEALDWVRVLGVIQRHTLQTVTVPDNPPHAHVVAAARAAAMLDGQVLEGRDQPFESQVTAPDNLKLGEIPGAMFRSPMTVTVDDATYILDRTELVFFRSLRIEPKTPGSPLRAGDTIVLTPGEPAAVMAVPHGWRPGDDLPQLSDSSTST